MYVYLLRQTCDGTVYIHSMLIILEGANISGAKHDVSTSMQESRRCSRQHQGEKISTFYMNLSTDYLHDVKSRTYISSRWKVYWCSSEDGESV